MQPRIRIVFFDALFTLVKPRRPITEQYSRVLTPYVGALDPSRLQGSFKTALKALQRERPAYAAGESAGAKAWWGEVIRRTAVGAGADASRLDPHLDDAVTRLLHVFSSREGYTLVDGALETLTALNTELGVRTGLVSNADARILEALDDLGVMSVLDPALVSEHEGIEKPDRAIWERACRRAGVRLNEAAHVGDEHDADVMGARHAGLRSLWFRPPGEVPHREEDEHKRVPDGALSVENLVDIVDIVRQWNGTK